MKIKKKCFFVKKWKLKKTKLIKIEKKVLERKKMKISLKIFENSNPTPKLTIFAALALTNFWLFFIFIFEFSCEHFSNFFVKKCRWICDRSRRLLCRISGISKLVLSFIGSDGTGSPARFFNVDSVANS